MPISMSDVFSDKGPIVAGSMIVVGLMAAWLASRRNDNQRKVKNKIEHTAAVNEAIQTISSVRGSLTLYRRETIEPALSSKTPWLDMQGNGQVEAINFPEEKLMFLLKTEHADLFAEYLAEERRYLKLIGLIRERSELVLGMGQDIAPDLTARLKDLTDGIITHTDESIESIENFYHRFREAMKEHLDGEEILEIKFEK